ncbi:MAG: hypothetical protein Q7U73_16240 [Rubrivivax sp.]|nr:hypothetical protein [Rubrivivax sp.]
MTAPWYDWAQAGVPASGRGTRPLIQKFASDRFIAEFLKEPQHSLLFDSRDDELHTAQFVQAQPGRFVGKLAALFPAKDNKGTPFNTGDATDTLFKSQLVGTGLRKLYLPGHARHYLVVCELHCDVPGLPPPGPDAVCQAGFVVRRQRLGYAPQYQAEALGLLRAVVDAQHTLAALQLHAPLRPGLAAVRASRLLRLGRQGTLEQQRSSAQQALADARGKLEAWQVERGVRAFKEGWAAGEHEGTGEWRELIDDTPQQLEESWVRLFPLVADPRDPRHSARGRALFYGLVPTSAFETTVGGEARYDDRHTYELRCFFRQHDCDCPYPGLNSDAPDCDGELVWSLPSEPWRLAPQFDLVGTSNRPVTVQMPNLAELAAQAATRPIGQFSPVRFVHPQQLQSKTDGSIPSSGSIGGPAICFFSIPLITIVASFVLNLFLPIVVLLFNLWFLLALRFCIPPSFSIAGGLQLELAAIPPKLDVDAGLAVDVDAEGWSWNGKDGTQVRTELADEIAATLHQNTGIAQSKIRNQLDRYSNAPLVTLGSVNAEKSQQQLQPDGSAKTRLNPTASLQFRPMRLSQWKHERHLPTTGEFS